LIEMQPRATPAPILHAWLPPILVSVAILSLSGDLGSGERTLKLLRLLLAKIYPMGYDSIALFNLFLRKFAHILVYGILSFFYFRALQSNLRLSVKKSFLLALFFCLVVASLDESHQYFWHSRGASFFDILLDLIGGTVAALIGLMIYKPVSKAADIKQ
jgi:VanZ family protein